MCIAGWLFWRLGWIGAVREEEDEKRVCEVLSFADDAMQILGCAKVASGDRRDGGYIWKRFSCRFFFYGR